LRGEGFFDAAQIADAVINDGDGHFSLRKLLVCVRVFLY
jgi:hypothetical protein